MLNLQALDKQFQLSTTLTRPGNQGKELTSSGKVPQPRKEKQEDPQIPSSLSVRGIHWRPCEVHASEAETPSILCHPIWMFPDSPEQKLGPPSADQAPSRAGALFLP